MLDALTGMLVVDTFTSLRVDIFSCRNGRLRWLATGISHPRPRSICYIARIDRSEFNCYFADLDFWLNLFNVYVRIRLRNMLLFFLRSSHSNPSNGLRSHLLAVDTSGRIAVMVNAYLNKLSYQVSSITPQI